MIGDKNDAYRPEYIWATSPPGHLKKAFLARFQGLRQRIRIKFVALLYQITHDLYHDQSSSDEIRRQQALRIEVNRKGVMGRRHSENNAPNRSKLPFRVWKNGVENARSLPYTCRERSHRAAHVQMKLLIFSSAVCPHFTAYFAQPSFAINQPSRSDRLNRHAQTTCAAGQWPLTLWRSNCSISEIYPGNVGSNRCKGLALNGTRFAARLRRTFPVWKAAILLVVLPTAITMFCPVLVRRIFGIERLAINNEIAGFKFAVVGVNLRIAFNLRRDFYMGQI